MAPAPTARRGAHRQTVPRAAGINSADSTAAKPCVKSRPVNETIERVTTRNIESILCAEDARRRRRPFIFRAIARVAAVCGTVGFLVGNALLFGLWMGFNESRWGFDPYPFSFLLVGVSLEAIFLSILILISQNDAAQESERRHHLDLQINLLAEREQTALMRLVLDVAQRVGVPAERMGEVRAFAHETDPSGVLTQIVRAERKHRAER